MTYAALRAKAHDDHNRRNAMHRRDGGSVAADRAGDKREVAAGVHKHEAHLHKGEPKTKLRDGGAIEGRARGGATNRPGGHKGGKTTINIVMPQGGGQDRPVPVPVPVHPPMGAAPPPGAGMPVRSPMVPPQAGMGPMPPGAGPGMPGMPPRARGGRMTGGALSGVGRLEKVAAQKAEERRDGP